jgi:hypothetical protein
MVLDLRNVFSPVSAFSKVEGMSTEADLCLNLQGLKVPYSTFLEENEILQILIVNDIVNTK